MARIIKVNYKDLELKEFEAGVTLKEISESFKHYFKATVISASIQTFPSTLPMP